MGHLAGPSFSSVCAISTVPSFDESPEMSDASEDVKMSQSARNEKQC